MYFNNQEQMILDMANIHKMDAEAIALDQGLEVKAVRAFLLKCGSKEVKKAIREEIESSKKNFTGFSESDYQLAVKTIKEITAKSHRR